MFLYKLVSFPDKQCIYGHKCKNGMPLLRYAVFLYLCVLLLFPKTTVFGNQFLRIAKGF